MIGAGTLLTSLPEDEDDTGRENGKGVAKDSIRDDAKPKISDDHDGEAITGVLFGRSVRAHYASLNLVVLDDEDESDHYHVMVRIQFQTQNTEAIQQLRSYMRRYCKNGDLIHISRGIYQDIGQGLATEWQQARFVVDVGSVEEAEQVLQVRQVRYWGMSQWQAWQAKLYRQEQKQTQTQKQQSKTNKKKSKNGKQEACCSSTAHHSGGLEKRQQGEYLANFLLNMIMAQKDLQESPSWAYDHSYNSRRAAALDYLNGGSGVLDCAGGSGHVSMALGILGIQSTVVDPREAVGKLPGRDRKIWNRALKGKAKKKQSVEGQGQQPASPDASSRNSLRASAGPSTFPPVPTTMICQPAAEVRPFETFRAWFGAPPEGVDTDFRNPDKASVPVCDANHTMVQRCRAILALHPDEATDAIVNVAVSRRIPFVIVPCCVFCRLFPNRRLPSNDGGLVSTYENLLDYLQAKDPSIQRATLPFIGANTVLYSTFSEGLVGGRQ